MYFLSHSRIARATWLALVAPLPVLGSASGMLAGALAGDPGTALPAFWFVRAAVAPPIPPRHDTGRNAPAMLHIIIPVLSLLWLFMLLCRRRASGMHSTSRHGADPLAHRACLRADMGKSRYSTFCASNVCPSSAM